MSVSSGGRTGKVLKRGGGRPKKMLSIFGIWERDLESRCHKRKKGKAVRGVKYKITRNPWEK